jgi:prepilin-type N-terminal cleavage/methylation domain-containing protein
MKRTYLDTARQAGFTLVETALVLVIVALLLGGMLVPLATQVEQRKVLETQKALEEIKEALIGYAVINGQLPCPADPAIASGQANAGVARNPPCGGANSSGVLPWATLGVGETDAWGNRYTYRVTDYFADSIASATYGGGCVPSPVPLLSSFALCSAGNLNVLSAQGGNNIATTAAVVISHGRNGFRAYTPQGTQLGASTNADEQENGDGSSNLNYVSHTATSNYDDMVVWLSNQILLNRMVAAGRLP